ncbi:peptidase M61 [Flavobacterium sp.]|jgi:predicted metalloprotease with PDZ domain|uniref:M61 family metallopeptidase n=1 Tax=Flavobacterium sp. TaxID=239 RepID=UPI0037C0C64D
MKKSIIALAFVAFLWSNTTVNAQKKGVSKQDVKVGIDLIDVKDDKVKVTVQAPKTNSDKITYSIPKIVPGTYSEDNYGKYIEDFKAFDAKGTALAVTKTDDNTWSISNAKNLSKITYLVNDTYDTEKGGGFGADIFSPAGTNIDAGKNFMLNTHGFVGYFQDKKDLPYQVTITHPETLWGATSMIDTDASATKDVFNTPRYAELVENPIMYAKPDYTSFNVNGMDIQIVVYSPSGKVTAESITPEMKKMMTAQKTFLGNINSTKKYTVLLYLSTMKPDDAKGTGALEHPTATTVVLPEMLPLHQLQGLMKDIVSHEFFHIVTPLTIHSNEIQYFDYNAPKMSQHLWMYEGVTEYFANLFQVNQGLIDEADFYKLMAKKIEQSKSFVDTMSFTAMSANVLKSPYKEQYLNVYEKGALIGMCVDIIIREKSNGERGILNLMQQLSKEYGVEKAFNDNELFAKITALTYPEVGDFLRTHVSGSTPINYEAYLSKVGVAKAVVKVRENKFHQLTVDPEKKELMIPDSEPTAFMKALDLRGGDIITTINGTKYNLDNISDLKTDDWKEGEPISITIKREGKEQTLSGKVKISFKEIEGLLATDASKSNLKNAWLKK